MKITKDQIISFVLLLIRLCWPGAAFIVLCTGMFLAFNPVLLWLDVVALWFIGWAWLSLFIIYIILGIAFIFFSAHRLRRFYGSEPLRIQGRMAILSGLPFYAVCFCFFMAGVLTFNDPNVGGAGAFFGAAGLFGFGLISLIYLLWLFSLLDLLRPTVTLMRNWRIRKTG